MTKSCVFCGKVPEKKSREHVIPQWLIKMTGDINRSAYFGVDLSPEKIIKGNYNHRIFSFGSFHFPACGECNTRFSLLEDSAHNTIQKIFDRTEISGIEANDLLDWFDKVRVGLWLGYNSLNKNIFVQKPNYHIITRLGTQDRMLIILKKEKSKNRLIFTGSSEVGFLLWPSCLSMAINNYYFINLSHPFLFAKRLGFPFPKKTFSYQNTNFTKIVMETGLEKIQMPIIDKKIKFPSTVIFQPCFNLHQLKEVEHLYDTEYVKNHCMSYKDGMGNIIVPENDVDYIEYGRDDFITDIGENTLSSALSDVDVWKFVFELKLFLYKNYYPDNPIANNEEEKTSNERRDHIKNLIINECENLILDLI